MSSCPRWQAVRNSPVAAPLYRWSWPSRPWPWQRIHVDFAGALMGCSYLIVVDARSKWPEIFEMTSTITAATMIRELRRLFAAYGLLEQLVSDNWPQFTAADSTTFRKRNGVRHIWSAPYHPSSNGAAERFLQTFKRTLKVTQLHKTPFQRRLMSFLVIYRTTPHATTNQTPCSLFLNHQVRTHLNLLHPDVEETVSKKQFKQKFNHDRHAHK